MVEFLSYISNLDMWILTGVLSFLEKDMVAHKVAFLTAGGIAPCLSSIIGMLINHYNKILPKAELIYYRFGYQGLLLDDKITITEDMRQNAEQLLSYGGSPTRRSSDLSRIFLIVLNEG